MGSTDNPTPKDDSLMVVSKNELHELHDDVIDHIKRLSQEMDRRFEQVGQEMDRRFEQVDKRFEQVDRRFEQIDRRFEQVDRRFDAIDARFEAQDRRFEAHDRRFEAHDKCFEAMESHIARIVSVQQTHEGRIGELTRDVARIDGTIEEVKENQTKQLALLEDIRARLS